MSGITVKKQEKVLKTLIQLCHESHTPWIYHPVGFEQHFPFVDSASLIDILNILSSKNLIDVRYTDSPESFNIHTLQVTPQGLDYHPQKALKTKERWMERLYGFLVGTILGAVTTYFVTRLLTQIFG